MNMEPAQLVTFARVATEGNVTDAAEHLNISQPAVSAQLKRLTEAVGEPLYVRHRYGIKLTAAGEALLPAAQAMARALDGVRLVVSELQGLQQGVLTIAASMTIAVYLLPDTLARFRRHYPNLQTHLLTRNSQEALAVLQSGGAELAFVEGPVERVPRQLEKRIAFQDELVLVVRPDHPLAARSSVILDDLDGLEVVHREPGSGTREVVERVLADHGVSLASRFEATGIEAVKEAVLHGHGASILSKYAVQREAAMGLVKLISLPSPRFTRYMTLLHPPPELCSRVSRTFIDFLTSPNEASGQLLSTPRSTHQEEEIGNGQ